MQRKHKEFYNLENTGIFNAYSNGGNGGNGAAIGWMKTAFIQCTLFTQNTQENFFKKAEKRRGT
jgi:hypothetical protein